MQLRRYKDILALKTRDERVVGFHAYNLELAELTDAIWEKMAPIELSTSAAPTLPNDDELEAWNNEINPDTKDLVPESGIRYFSINVAQICNLKCTYCAAGGDGTYGSDKAKVDLEITFKQLKWLLEKVPAGETFDIRFLGGEPLLYPAVIREIANYACLLVAGRDVSLQFSITTNGTLITAAVAALLADLKASVTISLDGAKEINDKTRPAKGNRSSTDMTLAGIQELNLVRDQLNNLRVNSVFGAHNLDCLGTYNFLDEIAEWDSISLNYSIDENDDLLTTRYISEMQKVADRAFEKNGLEGLIKIVEFREPLSRIEAQRRNNSHCSAGKGLLQSDTRGELYACNWFMNDRIEQVGSNTALDMDKWNAYSKPLIELNNCGTCWARHLCGGGCMAVNKSKNNNKHLKDINFCRRQRSLSAIAFEYYFNALTAGDENESN